MSRLAITLLFMLAMLAACDQQASQPIGPPQGGAGTGAIVGVDRQAAELEALLKKDPDNVRIHTQLGNLYMDASRFPDAIGHYKRVLDAEPANTNVRVDMGTCFRRSGRSDLAVETYRKALELDPNHANANLNLGVVLYADFNDMKGALPAFEKFLEVAPGSQNAPGIRETVEQIKATLAAQGQAR
jgi:tetratricopeptide (TPR) repeat protein